MVCIIATNVAPRELIVATEQVDLLRHGRPFVFTTESLGCNDGENPRTAAEIAASTKVSVATFIGEPIPRPNSFFEQGR